MTKTAPTGPVGSKAEAPMRADARRNRSAILVAAETAFAEEGLGVPVDEIARRAGVGAGTLYRHFPTKEALFEAVVVEHMQRLAETARSLADHDHPGQAVFDFLSRLAAEGAAKRDLIEALMGAGVDVKSRAVEPKQAIEAAFTALLDRAQAAGDIRADVSVADLFGLVMGTCQFAGSHPDDCSQSRMLSIVCDGLRLRTAPTGSQPAVSWSSRAAPPGGPPVLPVAADGGLHPGQSPLLEQGQAQLLHGGRLAPGPHVRPRRQIAAGQPAGDRPARAPAVLDQGLGQQARVGGQPRGGPLRHLERGRHPNVERGGLDDGADGGVGGLVAAQHKSHCLGGNVEAPGRPRQRDRRADRRSGGPAGRQSGAVGHHVEVQGSSPPAGGAGRHRPQGGSIPVAADEPVAIPVGDLDPVRTVRGGQKQPDAGGGLDHVELCERRPVQPDPSDPGRQLLPAGHHGRQERRRGPADHGCGQPTSTRTLPVNPASTASWAAAMRSRGKVRTGSGVRRSSPKAAVMSADAWPRAEAGTP